MIRLVTARARVLRIRQIEHRIAAAAAARGEAARANLGLITRRIDAIAGGLGIGAGETRGGSINAVAELTQRLATARRAMAAPIADADAQCRRLTAARAAADRTREMAAKLHDQAAVAHAREAIMRANANRPARRVRPNMGEQS